MLPVTIKLSASLTDEQHAFARGLVELGRFASVSAVLQHGVELLRERIEHEAIATAALVELLQERRSGTFVSSRSMENRLADMIARKRATHGVPD